jgi:hypothetical protein
METVEQLISDSKCNTVAELPIAVGARESEKRWSERYK